MGLVLNERHASLLRQSLGIVVLFLFYIAHANDSDTEYSQLNYTEIFLDESLVTDHDTYINSHLMIPPSQSGMSPPIGHYHLTHILPPRYFG